ncbi:MAG: hypothetical protein VW235_01395 [Rhodospirillaceae bacterium]|jgi:hypothetical protein
MADGFHIDGNGNLWIGSTSTNFTTSAPFYVQTDGTIHAESGDIGGLDIGSNFIQSSNYSVNNQAGYRLQSDGNALFYGSLSANTLTASGGTIGGTTINSNTLTGGDPNNSTGYSIGANSATFHDVTITGTLSGASIDGTIDGEMRTASGNTYIELSSDSGSTMSYVKGGGTFGTLQDNAGNFALQSDIYASGLTLSSAVGPVRLVPAAGLYIGGDTGTSSKVLVGGNSPGWSNVPATAGVTSLTAVGGNVVATGNANTGSVIITDNHEDHSNLANSGHNHNATNTNNIAGLDDSHNHTATNAAGSFTGIDGANVLVNSTTNNNTGVYHSHTTGNVTSVQVQGNMLSQGNSSSAILIYDNHGNDHHSSSDHTGNNNNNLATVGYVNSRGFTSNNGNSNWGSGDTDNNSKVSTAYSHSQSAHSNHNHSGTVLTTNGAGNLYATPSHGHNNFANSSHLHNYYAMNGHTHGSSGNTINAFMHDDRFLNINANTVPGLNVVNRLNPVTANFSEAYLQGMKDGQEDKSVRNSMSSMHKNTFRLTVQDVEQALLDDGVDTDEVAWLIDRLHYVDPWIANESEEKKEHGSRGLLNGELEAVLVQAIKDLSAKIDILEDRLSTLEK